LQIKDKESETQICFFENVGMLQSWNVVKFRVTGLKCLFYEGLERDNDLMFKPFNFPTLQQNFSH